MFLIICTCVTCKHTHDVALALSLHLGWSICVCNLVCCRTDPVFLHLAAAWYWTHSLEGVVITLRSQRFWHRWKCVTSTMQLVPSIPPSTTRSNLTVRLCSNLQNCTCSKLIWLSSSYTCCTNLVWTNVALGSNCWVCKVFTQLKFINKHYFMIWVRSLIKPLMKASVRNLKWSYSSNPNCEYIGNWNGRSGLRSTVFPLINAGF